VGEGGCNVFPGTFGTFFVLHGKALHGYVLFVLK